MAIIRCQVFHLSNTSLGTTSKSRRELLLHSQTMCREFGQSTGRQLNTGRQLSGGKSWSHLELLHQYLAWGYLRAGHNWDCWPEQWQMAFLCGFGFLHGSLGLLSVTVPRKQEWSCRALYDLLLEVTGHHICPIPPIWFKGKGQKLVP